MSLLQWEQVKPLGWTRGKGTVMGREDTAASH